MTEESGHEIVHGTGVAIRGAGIMLTGPSGAGKSDLALRLIDRGATLIGDDYVEMSRDGDMIMLNTPAETAGKLEIRSLGIFEMDHISGVPLRLKIRLDTGIERFPMDGQKETIMGRPVTSIALDANEPSAAIKVEMALKQVVETGIGQ